MFSISPLTLVIHLDETILQGIIPLVHVPVGQVLFLVFQKKKIEIFIYQNLKLDKDSSLLLPNFQISSSVNT